MDDYMFSQTTEYALRVVVYLASRGKQPATNREISKATHVPQGYLAKILQTLSRGGLVQSQRGLHGGSILRRDPAKLTLLDVISIVDPLKRIEACPLSLTWHGRNLCPLHRRIDDAISKVEHILGTAYISELLVGKTAKSLPLCTVKERK